MNSTGFERDRLSCRSLLEDGFEATAGFQSQDGVQTCENSLLFELPRRDQPFSRSRLTCSYWPSTEFSLIHDSH